MKISTKILSITCLILLFSAFLLYQSHKITKHQVLRIISPTQIVVDINQNGIEDENETINLKNIQSFSTKQTEAQKKLALSLKITAQDALGLGFLADNFAKETLSDKEVSLKDNNTQIIVDNKNYQDLLISKGLALYTGKPLTKQLSQNIKKVQKLNLRIFNNKSHKYHKLDCKYGLMAHNSQIIAASQIPKDAKPCKFCFGKHNHNNHKNHKNKKNNFKPIEDSIPYIKSPATFYQTNSIKIFLTDFTKVLKPTNTCNTTVCRCIVDEINNAQTSIDFAIYGYTKIPAIQNTLQNAQKRGVKIRFVYDLDSNGKNIYPDTNYLSKIILNNQHDFTNAIMHDKFFIFDNKKVLTGSANISNTDMSGFNSNVIILINSEKIANIYEKEFEQMYNDRFHRRKYRIKGKQVNLNDTELQIYFSPKDNTITEHIVPLIDSAQKYIYIPAFLITHKKLTQSLINASERGVSVKLILDATNTHVGASKLKLFRQHHIQAKTENLAGKLHSKSIIIDDTYTIIGSMNFSKGGESENDENLVIIKDKNIAIFYKTFFQYLWRRIPDKWLKYNARAESLDSIGSCSDGIDNDFDGKIDKADEGCFYHK